MQDSFPVNIFTIRLSLINFLTWEKILILLIFRFHSMFRISSLKCISLEHLEMVNKNLSLTWNHIFFFDSILKDVTLEISGFKTTKLIIALLTSTREVMMDVTSDATKYILSKQMISFLYSGLWGLE